MRLRSTWVSSRRWSVATPASDCPKVSPADAEGAFANGPPCIGSGPWQVVEHKQNDYTRLVANPDYVGKTLTTDPLLELDAHVTRDLTSSFWASLDAVWYYGGTAAIDGVAGERLNNFGIGLTAGYQITANLSLTASYMMMVSSGAPNSLQMDRFTISLFYGWHSLIEGVNRLESNK